MKNNNLILTISTVCTVQFGGLQSSDDQRRTPLKSVLELNLFTKSNS